MRALVPAGPSLIVTAVGLVLDEALVLGLCWYEGGGAERDLCPGSRLVPPRRAAEPCAGAALARPVLLLWRELRGRPAEAYYRRLAAQANGLPASMEFTDEIARRVPAAERVAIEAEFLPSDFALALLRRSNPGKPRLA